MTLCVGVDLRQLEEHGYGLRGPIADQAVLFADLLLGAFARRALACSMHGGGDDVQLSIEYQLADSSALRCKWRLAARPSERMTASIAAVTFDALKALSTLVDRAPLLGSRASLLALSGTRADASLESDGPASLGSGSLGDQVPSLTPSLIPTRRPQKRNRAHHMDSFMHAQRRRPNALDE